MEHWSITLCRVSDLFLLFLKLGTIAFGGPAAHIAMMRDEVVARRRWMSEREFLDLVAATNLIPGPNSTELAIHIGHRRAGWPGLLVAGLSFILPATLIVFAIAWAYVQYGARPDVRGVFAGIAPVIIAIVIQALWNMAKTAVTSVWLGVLGLASLAAVLAGVQELLVLASAGVAAVIASKARPSIQPAAVIGGVVSLSAIKARGLAAAILGVAGTIQSISLSTLFWVFLKTGAVLFGSGAA